MGVWPMIDSVTYDRCVAYDKCWLMTDASSG